jgi:ATP-dependent Clp protease ATP-binding subunit ClpC
VGLAQEEASGFKHSYVGTEHILLGLVRDRAGLASRALDAFDITVERVRGEVVRTVGLGQEMMPTGHLPFTARATRVLELSSREALNLGHNYIGTEHLLLGLAALDDGAAARILRDFNAGAEQIRSEVIRLLSAPAKSAPPIGAPGEMPPAPRSGFDEWIRVGPGAGARRLLIVAAGRALDDGRSEIESRDVLLALTRDEKIAPVLAELGVDEAAVLQALASRPPQAPPLAPPQAPPQASVDG